jgi:hypothetical protein
VPCCSLGHGGLHISSSLTRCIDRTYVSALLAWSRLTGNAAAGSDKHALARSPVSMTTRPLLQWHLYLCTKHDEDPDFVC